MADPGYPDSYAHPLLNELNNRQEEAARTGGAAANAVMIDVETLDKDLQRGQG